MTNVVYQHEVDRADGNTELWNVVGYVEPGQEPQVCGEADTWYPGHGPETCIEYVEDEEGNEVDEERWADYEDDLRGGLIEEFAKGGEAGPWE